jgi:hypothetical protein
MQVYYTNDARNSFQKAIVFGLGGSGKTPLALTAPAPFLFMSEPGLTSLSSYRIPYADASTYEKAKDCLKWAASSSEARNVGTIFFDSISALSENILTALRKKDNNDARKYSPETSAQVMEIVLEALGLQGKHVVMTSKAIEVKNDITVIGGGVQTITTVECFTAVPKLGPALPYHFDNVLYLSRHNSPDGREYGAFRCRFNDYAPSCRNRSGRLELWEPADINHIINKSNGAI